MSNSRVSSSPVGQALPWLIAALLVLSGSGLIAIWLNATAAAADRDTLRRGADAVQSTVEEQIRILKLAGTGTQSLAGQPIENIDLEAVVRDIDISVLRSLLAVVSYPVDGNGAGPGTYLLDIESGINASDFTIPEITLSLDEVEVLQEEGEVFFSQPVPSVEGDRIDYIVAIPVERDTGYQLIGVAFRPDRMVTSAIEAAGEGQYAVDVVDLRYGAEVVLSMGTAASDMTARRVPDGVKTALELVVRPGEDFPFTQSPWLIAAVLFVGFVISILILWIGKMSRARSESLADQLQLARELNESKDRFLATVSHELRTPLTVVLGVAAEIGPNWESFTETDRQELMTMMTEQAVEAANIVEDLLVAARSDPSQLRLAMENTRLRAHVDYALGSLTDEGRSRVECNIEDLPIYADTTRLRQILRNLLENAVRYGGEHILVGAEVSGSHLVVVVSDDGSNLSAHELERIFEPYEQTDAVVSEAPAGVGIGLYVSRLLARLMGGDLDCVAADGWTKFRLQMRIADDVAATHRQLAKVG